MKFIKKLNGQINSQNAGATTLDESMTSTAQNAKSHGQLSSKSTAKATITDLDRRAGNRCIPVSGFDR